MKPVREAAPVKVGGRPEKVAVLLLMTLAKVVGTPTAGVVKAAVVGTTMLVAGAVGVPWTKLTTLVLLPVMVSKTT